MDTTDSILPDTGKNSRLNAAVAITVAILATFMGVCKVKDDNIVQAMQQAQADKIDHWAYYQARNIREDVAKATLIQLRLQDDVKSTPEHQQARQDAIKQYENLITDQEQKKEAVHKQAELDQQNYDQLNFRDDQFDLSDALIDIAIALLAITALTDYWLLYFTALVPAAFGLLMGLAGLIGWGLHPDSLIRLLS